MTAPAADEQEQQPGNREQDDRDCPPCTGHGSDPSARRVCRVRGAEITTEPGGKPAQSGSLAWLPSSSGPPGSPGRFSPRGSLCYAPTHHFSRLSGHHLSWRKEHARGSLHVHRRPLQHRLPVVTSRDDRTRRRPRPRRAISSSSARRRRSTSSPRRRSTASRGRRSKRASATPTPPSAPAFAPVRLTSFLKDDGIDTLRDPDLGRRVDRDLRAGHGPEPRRLGGEPVGRSERARAGDLGGAHRGRACLARGRAARAAATSWRRTAARWSS